MTPPFSFNKGEWVVFDLDDTLYSELQFLHSGIEHIIETFNLKLSIKDTNYYVSQKNWIHYLLQENGLPIDGQRKSDILKEYRCHFPNITLREGALDFLKTLKRTGCKIGLITDGRSYTQRNKLTSLGVDMFFDKVIISEEFGSEKPAFGNYRAFNANVSKYYIGDNPIKDFITANKLGWTTIMLIEDGYNIHSQNIQVESDYHAKFKIKSFLDLI